MREETDNRKPEAERRLAPVSLLDDTVRMNWLNENGRVAKFSDGWNAWNTRNPKETSISHDIRKAIDEAMRSVI